MSTSGLLQGLFFPPSAIEVGVGRRSSVVTADCGKQANMTKTRSKSPIAYISTSLAMHCLEVDLDS